MEIFLRKKLIMLIFCYISSLYRFESFHIKQILTSKCALQLCFNNHLLFVLELCSSDPNIQHFKP